MAAADEHVAAVAALTATVKALNDTTANGFEALTQRLDTQNGRLRAVENTATEVRAKMVTTKVCEAFRSGMAKAQGAAWRSYLVPVAVSFTTILLMKVLGG